jgi:ribosomal protein S6--L-glutamate ligase
MKLAVLASPDSWYYHDLCRAAGDRHELMPLAFRHLAAAVGAGGQAVWADPAPLAEADALLVRTMPPGSLEQIVFRMDALGSLAKSGMPVINAPRALEAAVDKYLALAKLQARGLPVPPTVVCQTVDEAMQAFDRLGADVVVKPLFGSEGRGMIRVDDTALMLRAAKALVQTQSVLYLQQFVPHGDSDLRLLVIGSRVLAARRRNPGHWQTNVACGGLVESVQVDDNVQTLARAAADAVGAEIAGVDVIEGADGLQVIEVNAVPGWRALAASLDVDVAALVLEYIESTIQDGAIVRRADEEKFP